MLQYLSKSSYKIKIIFQQIYLTWDPNTTTQNKSGPGSIDYEGVQHAPQNLSLNIRYSLAQDTLFRVILVEMLYPFIFVSVIAVILTTTI